MEAGAPEPVPKGSHKGKVGSLIEGRRQRFNNFIVATHRWLR